MIGRKASPVVGLAVFVLAATAAAEPAIGSAAGTHDDATTAAPTDELLAHVDAVRRATVLLPAKSCAGFVAEKPDLVVTAAHCVPPGARQLVVREVERRRHRADVESVDRDRDLALLRLAKPLPVTPLELSSTLPSPGQRVLFAGRPDRRSDPRVAEVDRLGRCPSLPDVPDAIFTTLEAIPGDSGSPLITAGGEVVGVVHGGARCHIAAPVASLAARLDASLDGRRAAPRDTGGVGDADADPTTGDSAVTGDRLAVRRYRFGPFRIETVDDGYRVRWSLRFRFDL